MNNPPTRVRHLIVGAGFAGLGMAIKLQEAGERDFVVIEKGADVGGTWRDNTYPGAACDVPSQLYSFSFAPNPDWSRSFSKQPEILDYLRRVAAESGVLDRFVFDTHVEEAAYDTATQTWRVRTSKGDVVADNLITGTGALSEPRLPDIDGIEDFAGEIFHSARWNHDLDLSGKRVGVIGTGASAIQIVPELARVAGHVDVYQRTAPWIIPRADRRYSRAERLALRRVPGLQTLYRRGIYWAREGYVPSFTVQPRLALPAQKLALASINRAISDADLRAKVTPGYAFGCKRVLISNDYYPALAQPHVDLVTESIEQITATGIRTRDGVDHPIDVLVVATGFTPTDPPIAHHVIGREGRTLAEVWEQTGMAGYKGTTVHGFPNLFQIVGPNTTLGHSSMVFMIEAQVAYIVDAVTRGYGALEPRIEAQRRWNDDLQHRLRRTVWRTGGCQSWYLDKHGRITTLWPRTTYTFRRLLARFDAGAYLIEPKRIESPASAKEVDA